MNENKEISTQENVFENIVCKMAAILYRPQYTLQSYAFRTLQIADTHGTVQSWGSRRFARQVIVWYCEVIPSHSFKIKQDKVRQIFVRYTVTIFERLDAIPNVWYKVRYKKALKLTRCTHIVAPSHLWDQSYTYLRVNRYQRLPAAFHLHECKINILLACGLLGPLYN